MSKIQTVTVGQNGWTYINDTAAHTPPADSNYFIAVQQVGGATDAVINNTGSAVAGAVDFDANITIGQGDEPIGGHWTSITLVSGAVLAYHE